MGDGRTYDHVCALRAVTSLDGMTADFYPFDMAFLGRTATRIINEVRGINRVVYDVTSKPPRSEEHTSELQSRQYLVCRLLLEKKNTTRPRITCANLPLMTCSLFLNAHFPLHTLSPSPSYALPPKPVTDLHVIGHHSLAVILQL